MLFPSAKLLFKFLKFHLVSRHCAEILLLDSALSKQLPECSSGERIYVGGNINVIRQAFYGIGNVAALSSLRGDSTLEIDFYELTKKRRRRRLHQAGVESESRKLYGAASYASYRLEALSSVPTESLPGRSDTPGA